MLKETEAEETRIFCHMFIIGGISIGEGAGPAAPPWLTPMITSRRNTKLLMTDQRLFPLSMTDKC